MNPTDFRRELHSFDEEERLKLVQQIWAERRTNAEAAWRIGRKVEGYDRAGHWPHIHEPHDDLAAELKGARFAGLGVGGVVTVYLTARTITDPTTVVQMVSVFGFIALSLGAEGAMSAALPFYERLKSGSKWVARFAAAAGISIGVWLGMRVPNSPLSLLAENWEGVALALAEVMLILFAASAGSAMKAYSWSRQHALKEADCKRRLISLGEKIDAEETIAPAPKTATTEVSHEQA